MSGESVPRHVELLWVGCGGAIGAVGRYLLLRWLGGVDDGFLPWGTVMANITGSLLLGLFIGYVERGLVSAGLRLFLAVGLLGGFTTFSLFSYDNLELVRDMRYLSLLINVSLQVTVGVGAAALGFFFVHRRPS